MYAIYQYTTSTRHNFESNSAGEETQKVFAGTWGQCNDKVKELERNEEPGYYYYYEIINEKFISLTKNLQQ